MNPAQLKAAWECIQVLVNQGLVSAGHDISDGGIATTLLEMAFAGGAGWACGLGPGVQRWYAEVTNTLGLQGTFKSYNKSDTRFSKGR